MPVYLFTYDACGSWLPGRDRRFELRNPSALPANQSLGAWRRQEREREVAGLTSDYQRRLVDVLIDSQTRQAFRCFGIATDRSQVQAIIAWDDDRTPSAMWGRIKASLTRGMNEEFGEREWLNPEGGRRRVRNRAHFNYLVDTYLPQHRGLIWTRFSTRTGPRVGGVEHLAATA